MGWTFQEKPREVCAGKGVGGMIKGNYQCPQCGDNEHLYMRADICWNPESGQWSYVSGSEEDYAVDCTECDWVGPLAHCELEV
jgi:predicted RNA-binding Zn-ribbon protein involved in translation (DUF1610 family)